jgi:hypothetical protein
LQQHPFHFGLCPFNFWGLLLLHFGENHRELGIDAADPIFDFSHVLRKLLVPHHVIALDCCQSTIHARFAVTRLCWIKMAFIVVRITTDPKAIVVRVDLRVPRRQQHQRVNEE